MKNTPSLKTSPQNIPDAYEELTPQAFAAWIRLSSAPIDDFSSRKKTADLLNYSKSQTNIIIRELNALRYVTKYRVNKRTRETAIVLLKKPTISGPNGFVVLNNLFANYELDEKQKSNFESGYRERPTQKRIISSLCRTSKIPNDYASDSDFLDVRPKKQPMKNTVLEFSKKTLSYKGDSGFGIEKNTPKEGKFRIKSRPKRKEGAIKSNSKNKLMPSDSKGKKKNICKKTIDLNTSSSGTNLDTSIVLNTLDLNLFKKKYKKYKIIKSNKIKDKRLIRVSRRDTSVATKQISRPQPDWDELEQGNKKNSKITFSPTPKRRAQYIEIFNRSNRSIEKKELLTKFGSEVSRIYSRYRRMLQREANCEPTFGMRPTDSKYTKKIAELCIRKSVTPRQVLAYWHVHIGNFSDARLTIPPLAFLSSPANIETVVCSDLSLLEPEEAQKRMSPGANSFSDMNLFDSRVRGVLKKGGFDVNRFSDKELMSIQFSAQTIAKGIDLFIDDDLRDRVEYLASNLYKKKKTKR